MGYTVRKPSFYFISIFLNPELEHDDFFEILKDKNNRPPGDKQVNVHVGFRNERICKNQALALRRKGVI
jgi:hypothetical protein